VRRDSNLGQIVAIIARRDAFFGASDARSVRAASCERDAAPRPAGPQGDNASDARLDVDLRYAAVGVVVRPAPAPATGRRRTAMLLSTVAVMACIVAVLEITGGARPVLPSRIGAPPVTVAPAGPPTPSEAQTVPEDYSAVFGEKKCHTPSTPRLSAERVAITSPRTGARVGKPDADGVLAYETIEGTADLVPGEKLRLFFYATDPCLFYDMGPADVSAGRWEHQIVIAAKEAGEFVLYAAVVGAAENRQLEAVLQAAAREGDTSPALYRLPPGARTAYVTLVCCM
jgi:hypothetical protein